MHNRRKSLGRTWEHWATPTPSRPRTDGFDAPLKVSVPIRIYWDLRQYLEADPDPAFLTNQVVALPMATPDFIRSRSTGQQ